MTERIRTTISLSPEAYDVFKRMAEAGNMSVSRCMGDWLTDTMDAAQMITLKMEDAKRAPMRVVRELRAMVAGMADTVDALGDDVRADRQAARGAEAQQAVPRADWCPPSSSDASPPSSNTGVLVPPSPVPTKRIKRTTKVG